jgi:hypothetical protein
MINLISYCSKLGNIFEPFNNDETIGRLAGITIGSKDILGNRWEEKHIYPEDTVSVKSMKEEYNKMSYLIICE